MAPSFYNYLERKKEEVVKVLQDLICIPSYESELEVVDYLAQRLRKICLPFESRKVTDKRVNISANFGENGPSLILHSHTDTIPPGDIKKWKYNPFKAVVDNNRIYGLGAVDDKASLAAMVAVFEAVVLSGIDLKGKLTLMAVGGEEVGGLGTQAEIKSGVSADAVIVGEPTQSEVCIGHKGVFRYRIKVLGEACHASQLKEGINAISKASKLVQALDSLGAELSKKIDPLLGSPSLTVTTISGGKALNTIPGDCTIDIDRRLLLGEKKEEVEKEILFVLQDLQKQDTQFRFESKLIRSIQPAKVPPEEPLVQIMLDSVSKIKGRSSKPLGFKGCCDMGFFTNWADIPGIICGPGSILRAHKINEFIAIEDLKLAVEVYANAIIRWFKVEQRSR